MLNQIVLVGNINEMPITREVGSRTLTSIQIKCQRSFANSNGVYENDLIPVTIWKSTAEIAIEKLNIGDIISVRGRLQSRLLETKEGKPFTALEVVGEKISYIAESNT